MGFYRFSRRLEMGWLRTGAGAQEVMPGKSINPARPRESYSLSQESARRGSSIWPGATGKIRETAALQPSGASPCTCRSHCGRRLARPHL